MRKTYTAQDVLAMDPGLSPEDVEYVLDILHTPPSTLGERLAVESEWFGAKPLPLDADGLTAPMHEVNAPDDAQVPPIPPPPNHNSEETP